MKILVAIANYGSANQDHLARLLGEYRRMPWDVHLVVLSNIDKTLGPDVEVLVGLPDPRNPFSLPFAHRRLFAERCGDFDLFVYSEDDTLVSQRTVESFLWASELLGPGRIPGFLRSEVDNSGNVWVSSVHSQFRWDPSDVVSSGSEVFARFTNEHSACYLATRDQIRSAIASGGFLVPPHAGRYDMLCSAATDIYTQCGLRRYVCVSRLRAFLLPHLPNKYIGRLGLGLPLVEEQAAVVHELVGSSAWCGPLMNLETGLPDGQGGKDLYEAASGEVLELVPQQARSVLSIGVGRGETEAALAARGVAVTAIPVDPVFGAGLKQRGIEVINGKFEDATASLRGRGFDCVLLLDVLQLVPDPVRWLTALRAVLSPEGCLVFSMPNTRDPLARIGASQLTKPVSLEASGGAERGAAELRSCFADSGYRVLRISPRLGPKRARFARWIPGGVRERIARSFVGAAASR